MTGPDVDWERWNIPPDNTYRESLLQREWKKMREAIQMEPGPFATIDYGPHQRVIELCHKRGASLQIIVKMTSIELTPEKPVFPAGSWHVSCHSIILTEKKGNAFKMKLLTEGILGGRASERKDLRHRFVLR